jgi:hypothetical protein
MSHPDRRTILGWISALLAVPLLLGRRRPTEILPIPSPPSPGPAPRGVRGSARVPVRPPSHSVQRRG